MSWTQNWRKLGTDDLGAGGEGKTFRVVHKMDSNRHAVVKMLKREKRDNAIIRKRFYQESQLLQQLEHPALPSLIESNADKYKNTSVIDLYYVMNFIGGLALNKHIGTTIYYPDEAISFVLRLLEIIEYLHSKKPAILHRDIKPQNILVVDRTHPVLIDFGAALLVNGETRVEDSQLNSGNEFLRLPGDKQHTRVDVSHCCGVLFFLLTNLKPGDLRSHLTTRPHLRSDLNWLAELTQSDKAKFIDIFDRCFADKEEERFQAVSDFKIQLETILKDLEYMSPYERLRRSTLSNFSISRELAGDELFVSNQTDYLESINELAEVLDIPEDELVEYSDSDILKSATELHSEQDGKPLMSKEAREDIQSFLALIKDKPDSKESLDAAKIFYPAIAKFIRTQIGKQKQEVTIENLTKRYQELWDGMQADLALRDIEPSEVDSYQRYLDALNIGFDTEFRSVKEALYRWVWKFGICVFEGQSGWSSHRLYGIPRGRNGMLLMKTERPERKQTALENLKETRKNPLGRWSDLLVVTPLSDSHSTTFMQNPELKARSVLYESLKEAIREKALPLQGDLLCKEFLFGFSALFRESLSMEDSAELDLNQLKQAIENDMIVWFAEVIANSPGIVRVDDEALKRFYALGVQTPSLVANGRLETLGEEKKEEIIRAVRNVRMVQTALSSCESLMSRGNSKIENPYKVNGKAPIWLHNGCDRSKLGHNLRIVFEKMPDEYRSFVGANNFRALLSSPYCDDEVSLAYFLNLDEFIEKNGGGTLYSFQVWNEDRSLPKSVIEFTESPPDDKSGRILVRGKNYKIIQGPTFSATAYLKIFSSNPLIDRIYSIFQEEVDRVYKAH